MSHPQDSAVGISEVSSCFIPVQRGKTLSQAVTQLSPSAHSAYYVHLTLRQGAGS